MTEITPDQDRLLRILGPLDERHLRAIVTGAEQQVALEEHLASTPPARRTTLHVVGRQSVDIPCPNGGGCQWARTSGGAICETDGCSAFAREGMELLAKVLAHIGPEAGK